MRRLALIIISILMIITEFGSFTDAFSLKRPYTVARARIPLHRTLTHSVSTTSRSSSELHAFPYVQSLFLADGALDPETLESLGDIQELNEALDGAIDAANPAIGILSKLVASPAFLAVPIGAGIAVSFIIGYFIFSYGQGKDD